MNTTPFLYSIGDIVKTRKTLHLERYSNKIMVVMGQAKTFNTNEYKVIVCGYENQYYYFVEDDIAGKIE